MHNYNFTEEDTFDLALMEESFTSSKFINKQLTRKQATHKGYPVLEAKYSHKNGSVSMVKYIIQGPHYYMLIAHGKKEHPQMSQFLNSFAIKPFYYAKPQKRADTSLYYTVTTPVFPEVNKPTLPGTLGSFVEPYEDEEQVLVEKGTYKNRLIVNDTTGEKIYVAFYKPPKYNSKDSSRLNSINTDGSKTSWIVANKKNYELPNKMKVWEYALADTGSSRIIWSKYYYKDGIEYLLRTQIDTLSKPSVFLTSFFQTFLPTDTMQGTNLQVKKSALFFDDLFSKDSMARKRALKNINMTELDGTDLPLVQKAIGLLTWKEKKYIDEKKQFISRLADIPGKASSDYLKQLYFAAGDTVELQYVALESLLRQKTPYAYYTFKDILLKEPPVLNVTGTSSFAPMMVMPSYSSAFSKGINGFFIDNLWDSLELTATIFKDLLPLIDLDDYKLPVLQLLGTLVDSGFIATSDYEAYLPKLLPEAKQQLKKQIIAEKNRPIRKAQIDESNSYELNRYQADPGNNLLSLYATLLLPFWESNANVPVFFQQLLASTDNRLKYNTVLLLLRKNKPVPDSVLHYLATSGRFQYELYNDLKKLKKTDLYKNFNAAELAQSRLISSAGTYNMPDSLQLLDKLPLTYKGKKGFVYFFKYKQRKDDNNWKIASSGLMPVSLGLDDTVNNSSWEQNFTQFSQTKLTNDELLKQQLDKVLKQLLYAKRLSANQSF